MAPNSVIIGGVLYCFFKIPPMISLSQECDIKEDSRQRVSAIIKGKMCLLIIILIKTVVPISIFIKDKAMKKNLLTISALAMVVMSGSTIAGQNSGNIQFLGSVTTKTCDIVTDVNGATKDVINLGTASTNAPATPVSFTLKAKDPASCDLTGTTDTEVTFASPALGAAGLTNTGGTATGAWVSLTPVNATTATPVTAGAATAIVTNANFLAGGAQFNALLTGGSVAGTYASEVSYAVAYK